MKKIVFGVMAAAAFLIMIAAPSTTLAFTGGVVCSSMKVMHVGISPPTSSGVQVFLKNETGAPCGTLANGATAAFDLPTTHTDKTLAIILTAASLKKNVWVFAAGSSAPYALGFVQVLKISE